MDCQICGERPAVAQQCPGDRGHHYHGGIHLRWPVEIKATVWEGEQEGEQSSLVMACRSCGREQAEIWKRDRGQ